MQRGDRKNRIKLWAFGFMAPLAALVFCGGGSVLAAPVEKVLYSFCKRLNCADGSGPVAGLIADSAGNLYGTTYSGGASNLGVIFKFSPTGTYTRLHSFKGSDGANPAAGLYADSKGNLFGTTVNGGASNLGVVFKRSPSGTYKVLHSFSGSDGAQPYAGLIADSGGNLYGTTSNGGAFGFGTVFKLSPSGAHTVLYSFCSLANCADGSGPIGGLYVDSSGNLYGTTLDGGTNPCEGGEGGGTVFKLSPGGALTVWLETVLHSFCIDGAHPVAGLIADSSGNLYGTTVGLHGFGTVFKLSLEGMEWTETVLHTFCAFGCHDGSRPEAGLIAGRRGSLYGTTQGGGASYGGIVFRVSPDGTEKVLYSFCSLANCSDGSAPDAGLIADSKGNLYGTTGGGGASNNGTVFKLTGSGFVPPKP